MLGKIILIMDNNKKRREKESKYIEDAILNLGTKYSEISNPQDLLDIYKNQNEKCFWCKCKLDLPKLEETSYEENYNSCWRAQ